MMPRPSLSHPVRLQPPNASLWSLMWPDIVSRDWQLRSVRARCFGLASMATLIGSVAEELSNSNVMERSTCGCGLLGVDLWLVSSALNECFTRRDMGFYGLSMVVASIYRLHAPLVSS